VQDVISRSFFLLGMLLVFPLVSAFAQQRTQTPEEALKNIPQAGMCRPDDPAPAGKSAATVGALAPDLSCAMEPQSAQELLLRASGVAIDGRNANEYAQFHISGALNMRPPELRTKRHLQKSKLLLVGNGRGERELYVRCAELKKQGFSGVHVLRGGMPAWLLAGLPVLGRPAAWSELFELNAAQLYVEGAFETNALVLAPRLGDMRKELTGAIPISSLNPEAIKALLDKQRRKRAKGWPNALLLVHGGEYSREEIETLMRALKPLPVLVYSGSAEDLRAFARSQEAIWKAYAQGPKQPKCGL